MKQKQVLYSAIGAAVVIAGGSYLILSQPNPASAPDNTPIQNNSSSPTTNTNTPAANTQPSNSGPQTDALVVSQQTPGNSVDIDTVTLSKPGFVVIQQINGKVLGSIVGASGLLQTGTAQDLIIKVPLKGQTSYVARLFYDDGDGKFDVNKDSPVKDSNGVVIMRTFSAALPGE